MKDKQWFDGLNNRLNTEEEQIGKIEDKSIDTIETEIQEKNSEIKIRQNVWDLWIILHNLKQGFHTSALLKFWTR